MNKRQRSILIEFATVTVITAVAIVGMVNFKDWVNRSEAMRAMEQLGRIVLKHRQTYGSVPPESYVDGIKDDLPGSVRLGKLVYRARWIAIGASPDEILAYTKRGYRVLLRRRGYLVLRLDGKVEWMEKHEFEKLLAQQQSQAEIQMTQTRFD